MKRMQIYLNAEEYEALRRQAFENRSSISAVLRDLVHRFFIKKPMKKKRYAEGLLELSGIFHDTRTDVSERHDDYAWGDPE